jgi:hypothetical protein
MRVRWIAGALLLAGPACECTSDRLQGAPEGSDAGRAADSGTPPRFDAGPPPPVDAGAPTPDAGQTHPDNGCADGTREGYLSLTRYPGIAACAGAWSVPGLTAAGASQGPVVPTCGRLSGNSSGNPEGSGCSAADLCQAGWHICLGSAEVLANAPAGCADAVPADTPDDNNANYVLFAVVQHSFNNSICNEVAGNDNDIFGCGRFGQQLSPGNNCGVLNQTLASTQPNSCGYSQAIPSNGPWQCQGSNSWNEGDFVTKNGCPNNSCSEGGYAFGSSDKGGVLCCRDH